MSGASNRRPAAALLACATIALGGCASVSDDAQQSSLAALRTEEPTPRGPLELGDPTPECLRDPYRSLAPMRLPRPGRMPRDSFMRQIQDQGKLIVGVDQNTLRLGYFDPRKQRLEGFDIDLAREVADAIFGRGRGEIVFTAISTGQRAAAIVKGDVDLVASAFTITCERRNRMYFSSVYHVARQRLLVPRDSTVSNLADLRGGRVCATKSSTSWDRLENEPVERVPVALRPDCLVKLQQGTVDAVLSDDAILFGFQLQDPQTKIVGPSLRCERYGIAINQDHREFVRFVNGVLVRLRARSRLAAMREKWLGDLPRLKGSRRC